MSEVIVITGGRGFVGTHLAVELRKSWPKATIVSWDLPEIDPIKDPVPEVTGGRHRPAVFNEVDITKPETYQKLLSELTPDWVVHLAAISAVSGSFKQAELVQRVNVEGSRSLLESVTQYSPKTRVLVASSADIYGSTKQLASGQPIAELPLSEAEPRNPYGASKLALEQLIVEDFNDRVLRVRPFPHIGPGQQTGFVTADFASQIAAIERAVKEPVVTVGNLEAQRHFTDVRDVVRSYRLLMEHGSIGEVYHVASVEAFSIQYVLDELLKLSTVTIEVKQDPERMRPSDIPVLDGDASKLRQATVWQPTIPLADSLRDILAWWRELADSPDRFV